MQCRVVRLEGQWHISVTATGFVQWSVGVPAFIRGGERPQTSRRKAGEKQGTGRRKVREGERKGTEKQKKRPSKGSKRIDEEPLKDNRTKRALEKGQKG